MQRCSKSAVQLLLSASERLAFGIAAGKSACVLVCCNDACNSHCVLACMLTARHVCTSYKA